jgi:hypothetical protein
MRIQLLHLPAPADEYPFVLVIDECRPDEVMPDTNWQDFKADTDCASVIAFAGRVEIV